MGQLNRVQVAGTGSYVPDRILTNKELEGLVDTTDEWIVQRTGIRERRIADDDMASSDMAALACERALEAAGAGPADVDLVVCATVTPDHVMPSTACLIQRHLGLNTAGFDVSLACSGFVAAFQAAAQFVRTGASKGALVVGVDKSSTIMDYQNRGTCVIFGDGAGACFLRPAPEGSNSGLIDQFLKVQGDDQVMLIPAGGSRRPTTVDTLAQRLHYFHMDGRATFKFAVRMFRELIAESLRRTGHLPEELQLVVPHQVNLRIIDSALSRLGLSRERLALNLEQYGNTISASVPLALDEAVREQRVSRGDLVSLVAFGAGLSWGSCLLRW